MSDETKPLTPLDESLAAARQDRAHGNYFYDSFLNTELFVPVKLLGEEVGSWRRVGFQDRFHPLFTASATAKLIPVFDGLERLKSWAAARPLDYLHLKGHVLMSLLGPEVAMVLNPGSAWTYTFSPETIEKLRRAMKPVSPM